MDIGAENKELLGFVSPLLTNSGNDCGWKLELLCSPPTRLGRFFITSSLFKPADLGARGETAHHRSRVFPIQNTIDYTSSLGFQSAAEGFNLLLGVPSTETLSGGELALQPFELGEGTLPAVVQGLVFTVRLATSLAVPLRQRLPGAHRP
jgi:hypothetical protein